MHYQGQVYHNSLFAVNLGAKKEWRTALRMCHILGIVGVTYMDLLWADVGDTLGLTVPEMRTVRTAFGTLLGLGSTNKVPADLVPVIALIHQLRQRGLPDTEIERRLLETRVGDSWPEAVLARMEVAATAEPLPVVEPPLIEEQGAPSTPPSLYVVKSPQDAAEATARELVMDLRREICTHTVEERELLHRMNQLLQNLILEVRDLRYAFLLASSRKDRKRGKRGMSRLLSG
jgi:hypothetical protein